MRLATTLLWALTAATIHAADAPPATAPSGVPISYALPADGSPSGTWRVTLAIVDAKNPDWIISQFAAGVPRTVTAENHGRFSETWNGLDDNFMPVPPGTYAVKGICMPAERWPVDGEFHSVVPRFIGGVSAWLPSPADAGRQGEPFHGDPVNAPIGDVAVSPEGVAVFYYSYLENGLSNPLIDLRKPLGMGQFMRSFPSGGAGGGGSTCTDGETVWSYSTDGGCHVYRADGKGFGSSPRAMRKNGYAPVGQVTAMAAWRTAGRTSVFIAERGRLERKSEYGWVESSTPVDLVTVHAGDDGALLATLPLTRPRGLAARGGHLYGLHGTDAGWAVSAVPLADGRPAGGWKRVLDLPAAMDPGGLTVDGSGRIYVSEPAANRVYQYAADGRRLRSFGRGDRQTPGTYDREILMSPEKLASWTDAQGHDRLLVVEKAGPCRTSEWSAEGALLREFPSLQTRANDGWAVDPADPRHAYIAGEQGWLTRFAIDYASGRFTVDAVWPDVGTDPFLPGFDHVRMVRRGDRPYLVCSPRGQYAIYRLDGERWKLAAGIVGVRKGAGPTQHFAWRDSDGDGRVEESEFRPTPMTLPGAILRYHGEQVGADLALLAINQGGRDVWRLPVTSCDARGIPEFGAWERILTDPVFTARAAGTATALTGGNETADSYSSDWAQCDGTPEQGFWVSARGGRNFSANFAAQEKVSAYVPDGKGGMRLRWRVGRAAINGPPQPGETVGAMHIRAPLNGLLPVVDQTRCGVVLYDQDGLYVDTLFPPGGSRLGIYDLPGEFFSGMVYGDPQDGGIFVGVGKDTPLVFRCLGWSLHDNPVRRLADLQAQVEIGLAQIVSPPEVALALRGGAGNARLARFAPAFGGVQHDGSLAGWEQCDPLTFQADRERTVEVRCLWDPGHLHLRIHARTGADFTPRALRPLERVFAHDRTSDAVSFYLQGEPAARPGGEAGGRVGDVRIVLGLFDDGGTVRPAAIGFHPAWSRSGASPQAYRTPVGQTQFAHVGELVGAVLGGRRDADGKGYVVSVSIPREAIPGLPVLSPALRTAVDFEATFGGHAKVWWADTDGSASRETFDEPTEARLYPGAWAPAEFSAPTAGGLVLRHWLVCGPFGGPGAERFAADPPGEMKDAVRAFFDQAIYPPDSGPFDAQAVFSGAPITGWWKAEREVRWQPTEVEALDSRLLLGKGGAQVWYASSWVHAEVATPLTVIVHSMPQARVRLTLDDAVLFDGMAKKETAESWLSAAVPTTLTPGWHRVQLRSYDWGYGSTRMGVALAAPLERLWGLGCSGRPPQ
ncbi:MAG: hypothetical protein H0X38_06645 [Planctomycetes bacterium]|nr:hypothetical protein [Planctomycetota bacterium]